MCVVGAIEPGTKASIIPQMNTRRTRNRGRSWRGWCFVLDFSLWEDVLRGVCHLLLGQGLGGDSALLVLPRPVGMSCQWGMKGI